MTRKYDLSFSTNERCVEHSQVSLTVDHPQKVLLMGEAQDYSNCKAMKKNGDPCSQIVNMVGPTSPGVPFPEFTEVNEFHFILRRVSLWLFVHSMTASSASITSRPSIRRWAQRGLSCSRRILGKLPTRWRGRAAAWKSVCVRTASTTAACPQPPALPRCESNQWSPFIDAHTEVAALSDLDSGWNCPHTFTVFTKVNLCRANCSLQSQEQRVGPGEDASCPTFFQ